MAKYMVTASYTKEGLQGLLKEGGSSREATVKALIEGMGGTMEGWWYAFGDSDVIVVVDIPDDASMAAVSLAIGATGSVSLNTTVLMDSATIDEASKKTVSYRAPGA